MAGNLAKGARKFIGGTIEGVAQVATVAAVTPIAAAASVTGGTIKHTAKGIGKGFKTIGGMKRKVLGEVSEAAVKGSDAVTSTVNDAVDNATKKLTRQNASNVWSFKSGNNHYYRQVQTKAKLDVNGNIIKDANGNVVREKTGVQYYIDSPIGKQTIEGKEYGEARKKWLNSLPNEKVTDNVADIVQENSEASAGWWDGIPEWAKMTGAAVAGGIASGIIFDDD